MGFLTHAWNVAANTWHKIYSTGNALHVYLAGRSDELTSEQFLPVAGAAGVNTNDVIYESTEVTPYNCFTFKQTLAGGAVDVRVKLTSTDSAWSDPIYFSDKHVANPKGVQVVVTVGNTKVYELIGRFYGIQVSQDGAVASNIVASLSNIGA